MAKFHNYYVLCPLIDQKSVLGVSPDKEQDNVIVTLSRNIVNKYRLSDQKQIVGWTSKEHITSTVVFDKSHNSYVGVFNNNTIKLWEDDTSHLDKLKKHKFQTNILKIIPRENSSIIIFKDGNCIAVSYALENRKNIESKPVIKETDTIVDVACYFNNSTDYICYLLKNSKDNYEIVNCSLRTEIGDMEKGKLTRVRLSHDGDVAVVGIYLSAVGNVFALWSDSKMTCYENQTKSSKLIGSVPWISTLSKVSITWMNKHHLILFGSNLEQDGAIIVAYNTLLGVGACKYPMKMYTENAKLYCLHNRIIMEASNYIGVLPYVLEPKRNLSSLLGSHDLIPDEITEIADWGTPTNPQYSVDNKIQELTELGLTERNICAQIVGPLLEQPNLDNVYQVLKEFHDVPESMLVLLINYALKLGNFKIEDTIQLRDNPTHPLHFLSYLFQISFSDALLIPCIKNGLALNDTLFLINYISFLLKNPEIPLTVQQETKLFDWYTVLLDAFYQQYLMSKDENVTSMLDNTLNVVIDLINQLTSVGDTMPLINKVISGKEITSDETETLPYSIELLQI